MSTNEANVMWMCAGRYEEDGGEEASERGGVLQWGKDCDVLGGRV